MGGKEREPGFKVGLSSYPATHRVTVDGYFGIAVRRNEISDPGVHEITSLVDAKITFISKYIKLQNDFIDSNCVACADVNATEWCTCVNQIL